MPYVQLTLIQQCFSQEQMAPLQIAAKDEAVEAFLH
jgi:hypothetical protein